MAIYKKIYKGEFRCPRWFFFELSNFVAKLLDTNLTKEIPFRTSWRIVGSRKALSRLSSILRMTIRWCSMLLVVVIMFILLLICGGGGGGGGGGMLLLPRFDLSGLFEEKGDKVKFISSAPVSKIISKLEEITQLVSFTISKKGSRVSLEGSRKGVKWSLTIAVEIFELTLSLVVVEVKKKGRDKEEYERFFMYRNPFVCKF
ncbi:hypothetical protein Ahy_B02g060828 [Arachis hypogaea]|uniref:NAF domain-containing protein n=1 Tax=Arachis hypogaea TaxID=3818 RepID=A0A445AJM0_ARAHY|nr:hypothetical protein Ahy_B02g060828 [Arachis hypogaea]